MVSCIVIKGTTEFIGSEYDAHSTLSPGIWGKRVHIILKQFWSSGGGVWFHVVWHWQAPTLRQHRLPTPSAQKVKHATPKHRYISTQRHGVTHHKTTFVFSLTIRNVTETYDALCHPLLTSSLTLYKHDRILADFRYGIAFWKLFRRCPFVFMVRATCTLDEYRALVKRFWQEKPKHSDTTLSHCYFVNNKS